MSIAKRAAVLAKSMADDILRFIFFPECIVCEKPLSRQEAYFCEKCHDLAMETPEPMCPICRGEIAVGRRSCRECESESSISILLGCGVFDSFHRAIVHGIKYEGLLPLVTIAAETLAERLEKQSHLPSVDWIVPIPLHWTRRRQRGFNQSELIANSLGEKLGLPVSLRVLERVRRTLDQTGLNAKERVENMRGAFATCSRIDLSGRTILLVDDVTTTGATLNEAAKELRKAGCKNVFAAVIAVAGVD
ncbi:MAG: ComF family protein [Candidatus Zixiibacteriota bacterium]